MYLFRTHADKDVHEGEAGSRGNHEQNTTQIGPIRKEFGGHARFRYISIMNDTAIATYLAARDAACQHFLRGGLVRSLWRALTKAMDALIQRLYVESGISSIAIVAVGGYGRAELLPFSDIDLLVLVKDKPHDPTALIPWLYPLWNLKLQVAQSVYTVEEAVEAAAHDHTIGTSLMHLRHVAGDKGLTTQLKRQLAGVIGADSLQFVEAKLSERDRRHQKYGDSRFMLEPHVKEGKGGLRDLHTLLWLVEYCYGKGAMRMAVARGLLTQAEWRQFQRAYLFFSTVRAHLHLARGRADERLTFDMQTTLAVRLKFRGRSAQQKAERFMFRYFQFTREVGALTAALCALLEDEKKRKPLLGIAAQLKHGAEVEAFHLEAGRLQFTSLEALAARPALAVLIFTVAAREGLAIHPEAVMMLHRELSMLQRTLRFDRDANAAFLELLLSSKMPEEYLRKMNEAGVLAALIPEFAGIVGQMQYDGYHTYTVDEHTLVAIGNLAAIEAGNHLQELPLSTRVAKEIKDRRALYVGMLCHDIAKGQGGGHAKKGEEMVLAIARRLGLSPEEGSLAAWLVGHHLLLSEVAFKRDLDNPETIAKLMVEVQSPERLKLLLLVTVADIRAVGPTIFNGWKGELLRRIYERTMAAMGVVTDAAATSATPPEYAELIAQFEATFERPALMVASDEFRAITRVMCAMAYQPDALRKLVGVLAMIGASIVLARVMTRRDGVMIAELGIQDIQGHAFAETERLKKLPDLLAAAQAGTLDFKVEIPRRRVMDSGRQVVVAPGVYLDDHVSSEATVIEVNARDRLGLLYDILGALEDAKLQLTSAHIATYGQKAVDVFYVKDAYGLKLEHTAKRAQVVESLLKAVG
jgi:[protein-PII] uridylyltransferase